MMSGHGFDPPQERGEGSSAPSRPPAQTQQPQISNIISGHHIQTDIYKANFQAQSAPRPPVAARPIAPAPGPTQRIPIITTQSVPAQRVLSVAATQPPNLIPKVQTGTAVLPGTAQTPLASLAGSISLATTAASSSSTTAVIQGQPVTPSFPMASLINRGVHQSAMQTGAISQQVTVSGGTPIIQATPTSQPATQTHMVQANQMQGGTPIVQAFNTSHVPRGAAAASALTMPKGNQVAAAVMRAPHAGGIPVSVSAGIVNVPLPTAIQPRAVAPLRPGTPPVNTIKATTQAAAQIEQRVTPTATSTIAGNSSTVQITIQQNRSPAEPMVRPIISHIQAQPKPPAMAQHGGQKVVMSQTAATVNPIPASGQRLPGVQSNIALNRSHMARPKTLGFAQPAATAGIATSSRGPTHGLTISQAVPRQKIVMTQGEKSSVIPGTIVTTTGKPVGTAVAGQQFQRSKVQVMSAGGVSIAGVSSPAASQINITNVGNRPTLPIVSISGNAHGTVPGVTMTTATASTATSIPIAKVPPQRQVHTVAQTQASQEVGRSDVARPGTTQAGQPLAGAQGAAFLAQPHRASPSTGQPTTTITVPTTQTDGRGERSNIPFPYTLQTPEYGTFYNPVQIANYQNLFYQQFSQAHLAQGNSLNAVRPAAIVPTQPSIAATLQAGAVSVAGSQGVRINHPMMVTVDPTRHTTLSVHAQYAPQTDGKDSTGVTGSAANGSVVTTVSSAGTHLGGPSAVPVTQPNASPRPSILRKRTNDGITVVKKNLLTSITTAESQNNAADNQSGSSPKPSTPHDPSRENSQSSTDTASSAESTPQSLPPADIKIKEEPPDSAEHASMVSGALALNSLSNNIEASPRKKPRKQSLHANTEQMRDGTSTDEEIEKFSAKVNLKRELEKVAEEVKKEDLEEYVDEEGVRWTKDKKRPPVNLMNHYQCTWKTRGNHFQRYTDVKPKEERRPTVNELANQKSVHQKASGWKMYHLAAQLEEMMDQEKDVLGKLSGVQDNVAPKHMSLKHSTMEDDIGMIHELAQGNIQRCQLVVDQLEEARSSMLKILKHKSRISEIITKHHSKRPVKKKERT